MKKPDNHIIVIFGASGDLTSRKLIPAIFKLWQQKLLPEKFRILGVGRTNLNDETFRSKMAEVIGKGKNTDIVKSNIDSFLSSLTYVSIETSTASEYRILKDKIDNLLKLNGIKTSIIYYLATPPQLYSVIPAFLSHQGLIKPEYKLIIEKPFGTSLKSSRELNTEILKHFNESQIYRIDHYLGKETVQNILVTRFSNTIFEPLWNRNYVHHIEITSAESIGVESRGGYYDDSGALRDMFQNHLLQLVALVAMEPPVTAESDSIRNEMVKVFQSLRPLSNSDIINNVIRGQYTAANIKNKKVKSYRDEKNVDPDSRTETYVALKFFIDNWRWNGVPFYIRTGKYLPTRVTEIVIHFRPTPHHIFCDNKSHPAESNLLVIRIQPDEGLLIKYGMKVPGAGFTVHNVNMDFHYSSLTNVILPEAYERLLLDCMNNDSTLYTRADALDAGWSFINPILNAWHKDEGIPLYGYPAGTWGPDVADNLIEEPWLTWRYPCKNLTDDGIYCEL